MHYNLGDADVLGQQQQEDHTAVVGLTALLTSPGLMASSIEVWSVVALPVRLRTK